MKRVLVVGGSLAGLRAAENVRAEGFDGELTILGAEPHQPYDRPPLSKALLSGRMEPDGLRLRMADSLDANWILGEPAVGLDLARREVATGAGRRIPFDGLVVATGSAPRKLPALDPAAKRIFELRTVDDAIALRSVLVPGSRLVVVGAGFIGIEVASTARALGVTVEVVTLDPPLAVAGELVASIVAAQLGDHGVGLRVGRRVSGAAERDGALELDLDDGERIAADAVLVAVGAAPCTDWLAGSGLWLEGGLLCDESCTAVGYPGIVAAGDVARWAHPGHAGHLRIEHWTNAVEQARAAARTLVRGPAEAGPYAPVPSFWSDHFGTRVQALGLPGSADRFEVVEGVIGERRFAAAAYRGDDLVGAVAYGLPAALVPFRTALARPALMGAGR